MEDNELILKLHDAKTPEEVHKLFEYLLNRKIPKSTKIKIEVVDWRWMKHRLKIY